MVFPSYFFYDTEGFQQSVLRASVSPMSRKNVVFQIVFAGVFSYQPKKQKMNLLDRSRDPERGNIVGIAK